MFLPRQINFLNFCFIKITVPKLRNKIENFIKNSQKNSSFNFEKWIFEILKYCTNFLLKLSNYEKFGYFGTSDFVFNTILTNVISLMKTSLILKSHQPNVGLFLFS